MDELIAHFVARKWTKRLTLGLLTFCFRNILIMFLLVGLLGLTACTWIKSDPGFAFVHRTSYIRKWVLNSLKNSLQQESKEWPACMLLPQGMWSVGKKWAHLDVQKPKRKESNSCCLCSQCDNESSIWRYFFCLSSYLLLYCCKRKKNAQNQSHWSVLINYLPKK